MDASDFSPSVEWLGLLSFKNKKLISRTKFESAQKGCPGIYSGVEIIHKELLNISLW